MQKYVDLALLWRDQELTVLKHRFNFPNWPDFAGGYYAHRCASADQRVRTHLVVNGDDRKVCLRLPVQGEVETTREDLPSRTVSSSTMWLSEWT